MNESDRAKFKISLFDKIITYSLVALILSVAIFDFRQRRIPNFLVFPSMLLGMTLHFAWHGIAGLRFSLTGLVVGFCILLIPYVVKGMKAGDVKFLMAIGAFTGASEAIRIILITLLIYPLYAGLIVIREQKLKLTWLRFRRVFFNFLGFFVSSCKLYAMHLESLDDQAIPSVTTPFGVAMAAGTLISIYTGFLGSIY